MTRPLEPDTTLPAERVVGPLDPVLVAEQLAECGIAVLDPTAPDDLAHINAISDIFADLIDNGLSKSTNAPPDVINCIVGYVKPPGGH